MGEKRVLLQATKENDPDSLETLERTGIHPDATRNIRSGLKSAGCCKTTFLALSAVLFFAPIVCLILVIVLVFLPVLATLYCMFPSRTMSLLGIAEKSTQEAAEWMLPAEAPKGLPTRISGIIYMRLNPLSDDLVTCNRSTWYPDRRALRIRFYQAYTWSVERGFLSLVLMVGAHLINYTYWFNYNADLTEANITLHLFGIQVPSCFVTFCMTDVSQQQDGSLWERWSLVLGHPLPSYWAEKVVDGKTREKTKYWKHVLAEVPKECYTKSSTCP